MPLMCWNVGQGVEWSRRLRLEAVLVVAVLLAACGVSVANRRTRSGCLSLLRGSCVRWGWSCSTQA